MIDVYKEISIRLGAYLYIYMYVCVHGYSERVNNRVGEGSFLWEREFVAH